MPHNTKFLFYHDVYEEWQCGLDWNRCVMENCRVKAWGDSAYDAICNAFLAWRRNSQWQPIETAPKDGTPILGFSDGVMTTVFWENNSSPRRWTEGGWKLCVGFHYDSDDGEWWPEYWQPLPEGPNES